MGVSVPQGLGYGFHSTLQAIHAHTQTHPPTHTQTHRQANTHTHAHIHTHAHTSCRLRRIRSLPAQTRRRAPCPPIGCRTTRSGRPGSQAPGKLLLPLRAQPRLRPGARPGRPTRPRGRRHQRRPDDQHRIQRRPRRRPCYRWRRCAEAGGGSARTAQATRGWRWGPRVLAVAFPLPSPPPYDGGGDMNSYSRPRHTGEG